MDEKVIWEDNTTYRQGEKDRTPRIWGAKTKYSRIIVHRHRDFPTDTWLLSYSSFIVLSVLKNKEIELSKSEAVQRVKNVLRGEIEFLGG